MTLSRQQRVLVAIAAAGGACAIAIPAALALSHNPTFGQRIIPVHAPSSAHVVRFDDQGGVVEAAHHPRHHRDDPKPRKHGDPITSTVASSREPEPGDDRGRSTEAGDDRGRGNEPGDDRGASSNEPEPGDDRTTPAPSSSEPEPGDDHGGNRGPGDGSGSSSDNSGRGSNSGPGGGDDSGHHGGGDDGGHHHGGDH